jgi:hypothetical protein
MAWIEACLRSLMLSIQDFHHPSTHGNISYLGAQYEMTWTDYDQKRGFSVFDTETRGMTYVENPFKMFHKIVYDDTDMTFEDVAQLIQRTGQTPSLKL